MLILLCTVRFVTQLLEGCNGVKRLCFIWWLLKEPFVFKLRKLTLVDRTQQCQRVSRRDHQDNISANWIRRGNSEVCFSVSRSWPSTFSWFDSILHTYESVQVDINGWRDIDLQKYSLFAVRATCAEHSGLRKRTSNLHYPQAQSSLDMLACVKIIYIKQCINKQEWTIICFCTKKTKLTLVFHVSVQKVTMDFIITLSK